MHPTPSSDLGHVRELNSRGDDTRVVTCCRGTADGRAEFDAIPFLSLGSRSEVSALEGTVVFVSDAPPVHVPLRCAPGSGRGSPR